MKTTWAVYPYGGELERRTTFFNRWGVKPKREIMYGKVMLVGPIPPSTAIQPDDAVYVMEEETK